MASPNDVPRISEPISGAGGHLTQAWLNFFMKLASQQTGADLEARIQALADLVKQIQAGQGGQLQIDGPLSVEVQGTPANGVVSLSLIGDAPTPGNTYFYGTGVAGGKGWHPVSGAIAAAANQLLKTVGPDGVATLGLDPAVLASLAKADSAVQSIQPGTGVTVDNTDPHNPVVSATGSSGAPKFPFILQTGASYIPLTGANELPFFLANGSASNIPVTP